MIVADNWIDYTLIDASDGSKLEKWGDIYLSRPDPQAIGHIKPKINSGKMHMQFITAVNQAAAFGNIKRKFLKPGKSNIAILHSMLSPWALNTQVYFPNRHPTGIL